MAAGKVEIGCFRAYTNEHAEKVLKGTTAKKQGSV